jgi:modulator of FtsH protease
MPLNDYRMSEYRSYPTIIDAPREETTSLLAKVLGLTALGFLITAFGVATAPPWGTLIGFIAVLGLVFAISFAKKANPAVALGLFFLLAYFMGWEIGPLIQRYVHAFGSSMVFNAAATTGAGMAVMGCIAYLFNINYRRIAGIGMAALLLLIIAGIASMFFHFLSPDTYSWLTLGIFTLLTVGDFARIRAGGDGASAVMLALSIYLDGINIFLAVLQLMGGGRRRD